MGWSTPAKMLASTFSVAWTSLVNTAWCQVGGWSQVLWRSRFESSWLMNLNLVPSGSNSFLIVSRIPMVFLWFLYISYGFLWFSYGFPWFSDGFPWIPNKLRPAPVGLWLRSHVPSCCGFRRGAAGSGTHGGKPGMLVLVFTSETRGCERMVEHGGWPGWTTVNQSKSHENLSKMMVEWLVNSDS